MVTSAAGILLFAGLSTSPLRGEVPSEATKAVGFSYSRPDEIVLRHLTLELTVDFKKQQLVGRAQYEIDNKKRVTSLLLDTRDLVIRSVTIGRGNAPTQYFLGRSDPVLGAPLSIAITPETRYVTIEYATSPNAIGLQWLTPSQTAGKRKPFLYASSQMIGARSWIPCQDIPVARMTFRATIKTPAGMLALMSAINPQAKNSRGVYEFDMPQPIPSELITLAVGDVDFRALGHRTGVYAESPMLGKAVSELRDTERMLAVAESLYGPYRWGRYDMLILPPAYLWGGMENPRLTFASPTILAGDRSQLGLIAHELAHSWAGNLVTNATWDDFWLNESFATYLERRILEAVVGKDVADMSSVLARKELDRELERSGQSPLSSQLHRELGMNEPGSVDWYAVYEKGYLFLRALEEAAGRKRWDAFLRTYFDKFSFQSITTQQFVAYYRDLLARRDSVLQASVDLDAWIYKPGLPANAPVARSARLANVDEQVRSWQIGKTTTPLATSGWTTQEWVYFLQRQPDTLTAEGMSRLDQAFGFAGRSNAEIDATWLELAIRHNYQAAFPSLEEFLKSVGRLKYLEPLYRSLAESPEGLQLGKMIFAEARDGYHQIAVKRIEQILGR
jgi:leukotriene-A4 hydrolase